MVVVSRERLPVAERLTRSQVAREDGSFEWCDPIGITPSNAPKNVDLHLRKLAKW
jgi:hypothetical protein